MATQEIIPFAILRNHGTLHEADACKFLLECMNRYMVPNGEDVNVTLERINGEYEAWRNELAAVLWPGESDNYRLMHLEKLCKFIRAANVLEKLCKFLRAANVIEGHQKMHPLVVHDLNGYRLNLMANIGATVCGLNATATGARIDTLSIVYAFPERAGISFTLQGSKEVYLY